MQVAQHHRGNGSAWPIPVIERAAAPEGRLRDVLSRDRLTWLPELGVGWYPVQSGIAPYDRAYFDKLVGYSRTDLGVKLMRARCALVERHFRGTLIDVGSGCGAFITERKYWRRTTYGFDVCPASMEWLEQRQLFIDPHMVPFQGASMWDVLEHIADFRSLLANIREWLFLAIPIFRDSSHALESRHYRPDEHFWYFTRDGLVGVLGSLGFQLVEENDEETKLGREDIMSFAFKRA